MLLFLFICLEKFYSVLYLHDGFSVLQQPANKSVARLVEGHNPLLLFGQDLAFLHTAYKTQIPTKIKTNILQAHKDNCDDAVLPAITLSTAYSKLKVSMDL